MVDDKLIVTTNRRELFKSNFFVVTLFTAKEEGMGQRERGIVLELWQSGNVFGHLSASQGSAGLGLLVLLLASPRAEVQ